MTSSSLIASAVHSDQLLRSIRITRPFRCAIGVLVAVGAALCAAAHPATASSGDACPGMGDCLTPNGTPGCADEECCETICLFLPSCCETTWDSLCVEFVNIFCDALCGSAAAGGCFSANPTPACDDADCCATVCAADAFCCDNAWDFTCASFAGFLCGSGEPGVCGDPAAGSCFAAHPNPACNNQACCQTVCALSPSCCDSVWDPICVAIANSFCAQPCAVSCPTDGILENELCGSFVNDPCFTVPGGAPQTIACNATLCGRVRDRSDQQLPADVDVFSVTVSGEGIQRLVVTFTAGFQGFLALTPPTCGPLADALAVVDGGDCVPRVLDVCIEPGTWWLVVATGAFPTPGLGEIECGTGNTYRLELSCTGACAPICGPGAGPCFEPHDGVGCETAACCEAVCIVDPACCSSGWDAICAGAAVGLCGGPAPINDACDDCMTVGPGDHPFSTIGATPSDLPLPRNCDEGFGLLFAPDVWFCHTAECDGELTVQTCADASFDTRLAVYRGGCSAPTLVACNDDSVFCFTSERSRLAFVTECGETYLIRVGGFASEVGVGTLTIDCGFAPPCPSACLGDLTGDGIVDGADLGLLLQSWGLAGPADLNDSGAVDGADLGLLLNNWGPCR